MTVDRTDRSDDDAPPFGKSWLGVSMIVLLFLAAVILFLVVLGRWFA
jgi:hypothetical protein